MKKIGIIVNSAAGRGRAWAEALKSKSSLWGWDLDFHYPKSLEELRLACRKISADLHTAVVVLGGDGTQNQCIRELIHSGVPLFPFPCGTANDLAAELGIKPDWNQVQRLVDENRVDRIDLVSVNGIPFATVAGIGIGAQITAKYNEKRETNSLFKKIAQKLASEVYTLLSAQTVLLRGPSLVRKLKFQCNVFSETLQSAAVFICNQNKLGGNIQVASKNQNDDKRFGVLIIPNTSRSGLLSALVQMKRGQIQTDTLIQFSTDQLTIEALDHKPLVVFGDGEVLLEDSRLKFEILPKALLVFKPDASGANAAMASSGLRTEIETPAAAKKGESG